VNSKESADPIAGRRFKKIRETRADIINFEFNFI